MSSVSLTNYVPPPRFDGVAFYKAYIQESDSQLGPWLTINTIILTPPDTDPRNPLSRSFTVDTTVDNGWYRVVFATATDSDQIASLPLQNTLNYVPSVDQVGAILRSRTKDSAGNELGTFTDDTRPTYSQVSELIAAAVSTLQLKIGSKVSTTLIDDAARLAAIRAAMLIELSYFPDQVATQHSPYAEYKALWEEGYGDGGKMAGSLVQAIASVNANADQIVATNPGMATFSFPMPDNLYNRRM